jgi:dienelactone hydrolase
LRRYADNRDRSCRRRGVDHAFFDDTGSRYDAAASAYAAMLAWFDQHLS